jgi:hypothetical protein
MSHHFIVPTNENGMVLDSDINRDMTLARSQVFQFADVFLYSHGWWTNAVRAMEGYNRFTIEFSHFFRSIPALTAIPTLSVGLHWPSTLTEDRVSVANYFQALSFYTMEKRADTVGENSAYILLQLILQAGPPAPLRFHLLGHNFGCKVVCRALQRLVDERGTNPFPQGVTYDIVLLQGAFDNEELETQNDYGGVAAIPGLRMVITRSDEDTALGGLYPTAHRLARLFGTIKPALGKAGPTQAIIDRFGGVRTLEVGPGSNAEMGKRPERLTVANLTSLHQAHPESADPTSGHHSDIFHAEIYSLLSNFYFGD